jgi:UDP-N-acetylmuramate: L-alanyl-gamma-D-glutamyl-meso-diaminopimelate ligase
MLIDFQQIKHKQRIIIIGNEGTEEITRIAAHVLREIGKPFDYLFVNGEKQISHAPIILIQGDDHMKGKIKEADFLAYQHHIAVIHHIVEPYPSEYASFEDYVKQYEWVADRTPKAGSVIFNQEDDVALVIGKQEREDVKMIEYQSLPGKKTEEGFQIKNGPLVASRHENFPAHASAVKELLKRLSVSEEVFLKSIASYK